MPVTAGILMGYTSGVVDLIRSRLLELAGFRHAFFARPLSFGGPETNDETVAASFRAAADALGGDVARLYVVTQVHGRDVVSVRGDEDRHHVLAQRADAIVARCAGIACGVRVADCVPVLVADKSSGAVAAIHSGWQGTEKDVVGAGVAALMDEAGGGPDLVAAIGPHIRTCCFEVGDDVAARLAACSTASDVVDRTRGERPHVDLEKIVRAQLVAAGVRPDAIDAVAGCTVCDSEERFFSFRREREKSGRMLAAIVAR
jgi:YfiH family protein